MKLLTLKGRPKQTYKHFMKIDKKKKEKENSIVNKIQLSTRLSVMFIKAESKSKNGNRIEKKIATCWLCYAVIVFLLFSKAKQQLT